MCVGELVGEEVVVGEDVGVGDGLKELVVMLVLVLKVLELVVLDVEVGPETLALLLVLGVVQ